MRRQLVHALSLWITLVTVLNTQTAPATTQDYRAWHVSVARIDNGKADPWWQGGLLPGADGERLTATVAPNHAGSDGLAGFAFKNEVSFFQIANRNGQFTNL